MFSLLLKDLISDFYFSLIWTHCQFSHFIVCKVVGYIMKERLVSFCCRVLVYKCGSKTDRVVFWSLSSFDRFTFINSWCNMELAKVVCLVHYQNASTFSTTESFNVINLLYTVNKVITGWFIPLMCLTLWTNSCVSVSSSTQITWSAIFDIPRVCSPLVVLYLTFLSCFSFLCFAKSSVVSRLNCLSTPLTDRCFSSVYSFSITCGFVHMNGVFLSLSFTLPWNPRPE